MTERRCDVRRERFAWARKDCSLQATFTVKTTYDSEPVAVCGGHLAPHVQARPHGQAVVTVITGEDWAYSPVGRTLKVDPATTVPVEPDPADETTVLVMGDHYWGKGSTLTEAKANFTRFGGALRKGYTILTFGPGSDFKDVDGMGRVSWFGADPIEQVVAARKGRSA